MKFSALRDWLLRELSRTGNVRLFDGARQRFTALAPFATPALVVEAALGLRIKPRLPAPVVDAVVRAVLILNSEQPRPLWTAILVGAFYPMLTELRRRLVSDAHTADELDQLVFECHLEACAKCGRRVNRDRLAMRIKGRTRAGVFRRIRRLHRDSQHVARRVEEAVALGGTTPFVLVPQETEDEIFERTETFVGCEEKRSDLEALVVALPTSEMPGVSLRALVRGLYPDATPQEQARAYDRIKRKRERRRKAALQSALSGRTAGVERHMSAEGPELRTSHERNRR